MDTMVFILWGLDFSPVDLLVFSFRQVTAFFTFNTWISHKLRFHHLFSQSCFWVSCFSHVSYFWAPSEFCSSLQDLLCTFFLQFLVSRTVQEWERLSHSYSLHCFSCLLFSTHLVFFFNLSVPNFTCKQV